MYGYFYMIIHHVPADDIYVWLYIMYLPSARLEFIIYNDFFTIMYNRNQSNIVRPTVGLGVAKSQERP